MVHSKLIDMMPPKFGYVVLVGVGSTFVNMWMAMNVARARKKFEIKPPKMYSEDNDEFNCIQRAHQNTLEGYPQFLFLLLTSGLQYPIAAAGGGTVYLLGRIVYAKGYYSGDATKRSRGSFGYIGLLVMLGGTLGMAFRQLGCCSCKA